MMYRSFLLAFSVLALAGAAHAQTPDLSSLHDALHLTAAQESAWRSYTHAINPDPQAEARHRQAGLLLPTLTTPRRVDLIDAEMEDDLAVMQRQGEAVKAFYALLTPSQQRTFDHQTKPNTRPGGTGGALHQPPTSALRQPQ
jgi:protein CpxP